MCKSMKEKRFRAGGLLIVVLIALTTAAHAEDGLNHSNKMTEDSTAVDRIARKGVVRRDPFTITEKMVAQKQAEENKSLIDGLKKSLMEGIEFRPRDASGILPKMFLRGHLEGHDGQVIALIEIQDGGVHMVREGDTVGLSDFGYDSVILIKQINRLHVIIESGSLGKMIIVR